MPQSRRSARFGALLPAAIAVLGVAASLSSCAYYNTFYIARKYYSRATLGEPYLVDRNDSPDLGNLNKTIDYSKKLLANYPKSKWVDDAYLLWAKAFLAKNDPLQTVSMLQDFATRFPTSPLKGEAIFYRAVALRQARRYGEALIQFDEFLKASPRGELVPYAHLERARTLRSLDRPADAAAAAGIVVDRWPKSPLAVTARTARAEAALAQGEFELARKDFRFMGEHSRTDDERLDYLLRESECLEAAHRYDEAQSLLRGALGHERPPERPDTTGGRPLVIPQTAGYDRYGRLLTRLGTVQLLSGDAQGALASYRRVVDDYPRTPVSAEAQYRVGYALEVGADDFEGARTEYGKVKDQSPASPFVAQATQRQNTLDQLVRFRAAGADSFDRRAQGGFLLAEQYLFQLDKPDRALTEYAKVTAENPGSPWAGKALNAQAWVLKNKFNKPAEAESLYWKVVHEYPATEAQLAARDYLEALGRTVPSDIIKLPPEPVRDTTAARPASSDLMRPLTPAPQGTPPLGMPLTGPSADSAAHAAMSASIFGGQPVPGRPNLGSGRGRMRDSLGLAPGAPGAMNPGASGEFLSGPVAPPHPAPGATPATADSARMRFAPRPVGPMTAPMDTARAFIPGSRPNVAPMDTARAFIPGSRPNVAPMDTARAFIPGSRPAAASTRGRDSSAVAVSAPDTAAHVPLPPLEFSPVRPGITFPSGPPRALGLSSRDAARTSTAPRESPIIGGPAATSAAGRGAPGDSTRPVFHSNVPDSLRNRAGVQPFQPRGSRIQ